MKTLRKGQLCFIKKRFQLGCGRIMEFGEEVRHSSKCSVHPQLAWFWVETLPDERPVQRLIPLECVTRVPRPLRSLPEFEPGHWADVATETGWTPPVAGDFDD